ncbi:MAG TPA: hypothetical protein VLT33_29025 [Labilithrix sp.]|nr:hypothetical protein [Labilithrix sp.]
MTRLSLRTTVSLLAVASLAVAGRSAADAAPTACASRPPTADLLEMAARRELGSCASLLRNASTEPSVVSTGAEATPSSIRAFIGNHPREFGIASLAELPPLEPADPMSRVFMRQRVPGLPQAVVYCHATEPVVGEQVKEVPWAVRGIAGYWEVCLLPDLANAAKRPRISESAAKAIAVAESRESADEAPRAGAVAVIARRRHDLYDRRGVVVFRVTVLEAIGVRYVDVEADTGMVLGTTWTSTQPTPAVGDGR